MEMASWIVALIMVRSYWSEKKLADIKTAKLSLHQKFLPSDVLAQKSAFRLLLIRISV